MCIESHELSNGAVLKQWSHKDPEDNTNKVGMVRVDQENNSLGYVYKNVPITRATRFPGYCKQHDEELFIELDKPNQDINDYYVNLQSLKILKYEKFNLSRNVRISEDYIVALQNLLLKNKNHNEFSVYIKECIQRLEKKRSQALAQLDIMNAIYCKLWDGICSKKYIVKYVKKSCDISGWGFSVAYVVNNSSVDFLFKVDINSQPVLVYAWSQSENLAESEQFSEVDIACCIMQNKTKLVFSKDFWEKTDELFRTAILDNDNFSGLSRKPMGIIPCMYYLFGKEIGA